MISAINDIDSMILLAVHEFIASFGTVFTDKSMIFLTSVGDKGIVWFIASAILLMNKKTRAAGIVTLFALIFAAIIGDGILKHLAQRPRPFTLYPYIELIVKKPLSFSFPSGHSAMSFAAAYALGSEFNKYKPGIYIFAVLIALSRLYLFMHYPSDIVAGAILGIFCGYGAIRAINMFCKR